MASEYGDEERTRDYCDLFYKRGVGFGGNRILGGHKSDYGFDIRNPWFSRTCSTLRNWNVLNFVSFLRKKVFFKMTLEK